MHDIPIEVIGVVAPSFAQGLEFLENIMPKDWSQIRRQSGRFITKHGTHYQVITKREQALSYHFIHYIVIPQAIYGVTQDIINTVRERIRK